MPTFTDEAIITTVHDFKTNIAKYIRMLERGDYALLHLKRYRETIGYFVTAHSEERYNAREQRRKEWARRGDDWYALTDTPNHEGLDNDAHDHSAASDIYALYHGRTDSDT